MLETRWWALMHTPKKDIMKAVTEAQIDRMKRDIQAVELEHQREEVIR